MTQEQVEQVVATCVGLIKVDAKGIAEAHDRTAKFLVAQTVLIDRLKAVEVEIGKHNAVVDMAYASAIKNAEGKDATARKAAAECEETYSKENVTLTELEANKSWLRAYIRVFENAHLTFRQYSKEG